MKRLIEDRIILGQIRSIIDDFRRDGSSHIFSKFRIECGFNATMNDKFTAVILSNMASINYFFRIKFIIHLETGNWIIRDKFAPILKDGRTITVNRNSISGLLTGIDKPYYERSYPVFMEYIRGMRNQKYGKTSTNKILVTSNSVAELCSERVSEQFTNALRGNKLTDLRRKKINEGGLTVKERGATIKHIA